MMRSSRSLLTVIFLSGIPAIAVSAEKAPDCTAKNSEEATVPQIASHPERYDARCVAVRGVMHRAYLYESVDGVYLRPVDILSPSSSGFVLGLDNIRRHFDERYRHVSIIGRVQDCEEIRDWVHSMEEEDQIIMVSGYCHSFNGAYLWVKELRFRQGPPFFRQMGRHTRPDYGDLNVAPDDWPHRATVDAQADKFLTALRAGDRDSLARIHYGGVGLQGDDEQAEMLRFLLSDRKSPFASIRTARDPPQRAILVYKPYPIDEDESADKNDFSATICFCREPDCAGRWPIASFDADNIPGRPYACTELLRNYTGRRYEPRFDTRFGKGGLKEPRAGN